MLVDDPKREFRMFRLTATSPMGTKRGTGKGGFIDSVLTAVDGFYEAVVQQMRPWTAKAPQFPAGGRTAAERAGLDVTPPSEDLVKQPAAGAPPEAPVPEAVETGVGRAAEAVDARGSTVDSAEAERSGPADSPQAGRDEDELVSWNEAQERLDHERALETQGTDAEPVSP